MMARWMEFFFEAMSGPNSYAGKGGATPVRTLPGWKGYEVADGPYRLVDQYCPLGNNFSTGHTILWENGLTRLHMTYGGWYEKDAAATLRAILQDAYKKKHFCGFRGPEQFISDLHIYRNEQTNGGAHWRDSPRGTSMLAHSISHHFMQGGGLEVMETNDRAKRLVGWHKYDWITCDPKVE